MGHGRGLWVSRPHLASFAPLLKTLRGAQVRRISWVRGVRPVGGSASGLLMKLFPTGQLFPPVAARTENEKGRPRGAPFYIPDRPDYLILASRNSTCFLATGSYFFLVILSVIVR